MQSKTNSSKNRSFNNQNIDPRLDLSSSTALIDQKLNRTFFSSSKSTPSKPATKNLLNKGTVSKVIRIPLNSSLQDTNIMRISQFYPDSKHRSHMHKHSNIELLKKEFEYLQQDDTSHNPFPNYESFSIQLNNVSKQKLKEIQNYCSRVNLFETVKNNSKGFIIAPKKEKTPLFQRKINRNYLKKKEKVKKENDAEDNPEKMGKTFSKFELIAPYRKYFQSNRFNKNKSCTMKIDEILGRRITKLSKFTLQEQF